MPRMKVSRKAQQKTLVVQPSRLRMYAVYVVLFALALVFGMLFRLLSNGWAATVDWASSTWLTWLAIIFGGAALMAFIERGRWTLRLLDGGILEGPTGMFGERITIPPDEIDWERTRRSLLGRLKIGNAIYGRGRTRILVSPWFFEPAALGELLGELGFDA